MPKGIVKDTRPEEAVSYERIANRIEVSCSHIACAVSAVRFSLDRLCSRPVPFVASSLSLHVSKFARMARERLLEKKAAPQEEKQKAWQEVVSL